MRSLFSGLPSASLVALLAISLVACGTDAPDPAPTVALAKPIRGAFAVEREDFETPVLSPTRVETGSLVKTGEDGRGIVELDSGAMVLLDRSTQFQAELEKITLKSGRVWIDARTTSGIIIDTGSGEIEATDGTFAVSFGSPVRVYCASGGVTYRAEGGSGDLAQGETLLLGEGEPEVEPSEMWDDWTGGLADPSPQTSEAVSHIGVLSGRTIGQFGVARAPLPIRGHEVNATIRGDLAQTEVIQTFFNARSEQLEAEYLIRLPAGALVHGFAIDQGAGFVEANIGVLQGEGYNFSWEDAHSQSSRLYYDGPDRLRARVFPIAPGQTVRIKMSYTEWLDRRGERRTYVYPMQSGPRAPTIAEFVFAVDATGADAGAFRAGMGATVEQGRIVLRRSDFRPFADFYLDLIDKEDYDGTLARAYLGGPDADVEAEEEDDEIYVLIDVPTEDLVEEDSEPAPLELVIVVDSSGATDPENLELSRAIVESILRQLAPTDRVAIRLADVTAHVPPGAPDGLTEATAEAQEAILASLTTAELGGASDLGESLRQAATLAAGKPRGAVIYLGDGIPTTGGLDATSIQRTLSTLDSPPRFFGFGVGDGSNVDLLSAIFQGGATLVRERTEASRAVMHVLSEAARPTLRGVTVDLGEGIERIYPRPPLAIADGAHIRLVGRLVGDLPEEVFIRGSRDGERFEATVKLHEERLVDLGDVRRRWATNRAAELIDSGAGREAMVDLGVRFGVMTPWTAYVIGGGLGAPYQPIMYFDNDPSSLLFGLGGRGATLNREEVSGWRRRLPGSTSEPLMAAESTWIRRSVEVGAESDGESGLANVAVRSALLRGDRGPQGCYQRKLTVRPDLAGRVNVRVGVSGDGGVAEAEVLSSSLGASDVDRCILNEIRGMAFPSTGATTVTTINHTYLFVVTDGSVGIGRTCSDAAELPISRRAALWRERLRGVSGAGEILQVWSGAGAQCELGTWRARRTLLGLMLRTAGLLPQQVALYASLRGDPAAGEFLRSQILRRVRTPEDYQIARGVLGLAPAVNWGVFARDWNRNESPEARIRLVRQWLEVLPEEMDLRLRLLALLEDTEAVSEAKRLARSLVSDSLADARVLTRVGEFWLRQDDATEAKRAFSALVESAPLDPWARSRLGDLYLAHDWSDDAYREYSTLAQLQPNDTGVTLRLARAAAQAGRIDEALRLQQTVSETDEGTDGGAGTFATLWTQVRLAHLLAEADSNETVRLRRRQRESGALRDPPAMTVLLTWPHPDDAPELLVRYPSTDEDVEFESASMRGGRFGIEAVHIRDREEGEYVFSIRRNDQEELRDLSAELMVILAPGTADQTSHRVPVRLTRTEREVRITLDGASVSEAVPVRTP